MEKSEAFEILARKWHPRIIRYLVENGKSSFSSLKSGVEGISSKALSESLDDLREKELVQKKDEKYVLTDKGDQMEKIFESIEDWEKKFSSGEKVLIMEDDESQAQLYSRWLEPDYEVSTASTPVEFYEQLDERPDVVIMDRDLGKSSASELLKETELEAPVVMATGKEPSEKDLGLEVYDYLLKPVSRETLYAAVNSAARAATDGSQQQAELLKLLAKKKIIARKGENLEKYEDIQERIDQLREEMDETPRELSDIFSS